ncbi:uncharacterized protein LOC141839554 [Curcuma longa]|uniref:uncharacterized protein LOC141839554 n=1 Tax=Curcuma longa TaxID=136217 RepID=UPI003D9EEB68
MGSMGAVEESAMKTEDEGEAGCNMAAVLDFDILCATVALQTKGISVEQQLRNEEGEGAGEEEMGVEFAGVQRMWEGDIVDCFDDQRIAIETACCPCYRFGKNMRRANLGSCLLQAIVYFIFIAGALFNFIVFGITSRHWFLYLGASCCISAGLYLGFFRARMKRQFNIKGNKTPLDDYLNHLLCPCCTLCQESRTLEMNNVHNGVWHGRGNTICLTSGGLGSMGFKTLHQPAFFATRSPGHCNMERMTNDNEHSWSIDASHSKPLVPLDQLV